jgi:hypothetical protein
MAKQWTVMVFMGANNIDGERDLSQQADSDLKEMQDVGSNENLNIVVQIDRKSGPERLFIRKDGPTHYPVPAGQGSTGDQDVLENFLGWVKSTKEFQAKNYLLVIWGHAYRLAFGRDGHDAMEFPKLSGALEKFKRANRNKMMDIVGFDACGMSILEGAYQLRDTAGYLVASQVSVPLPGWPYKEILKKMAANTPIMWPWDVGALIVRRYVRSFTNDSVTMTLLDLSRGTEIGRAVADLTSELLQAAADRTELETIDSLFAQCHVTEGQLAIDLATFCWNLMNYSGVESVRAKAIAVGDLLINPQKPFVLEHGRSNLSVGLLQGVSIFAPNVEAVTELESLRQSYDELDMAADTAWGQLVFTLAESN